MTAPLASTTPGRGVRILAYATGTVTLLLLVAGGLVTSKGAGMAVPDWPTSYGYNMFTFPVSRWIGPIAFEHMHRLLGSLVGLCTLALAGTVGRFDRRCWMRWLGVLAVIAVTFQGVLGGFRVIRNERLLAVVHGSFAHAFFALTITIALATSRAWDVAAAERRDGVNASGVRALALATVVLVYGQILLGARLRHFSGTVFLHLGGALVVTAAGVVLRYRAARVLPGTVAARFAFGLQHVIALQLALGVFAYVAKFMAPVPELAPWPVVLLTVAHQVNGALVLSTALATALLTFRTTAPAGAAAVTLPEGSIAGAHG